VFVILTCEESTFFITFFIESPIVILLDSSVREKTEEERESCLLDSHISQPQLLKFYLILLIFLKLYKFWKSSTINIVHGRSIIKSKHTIE